MKIGDLNPATYNPRKISADGLSRLSKALDELGDLAGIVKNIRTGNLVSGHQRIKCMPKDTEIHITDRYDPPKEKGTVAEGYILFAGEKHKYREVDWPLDKEKLANLAANNQGGENDNTKLAVLIAELQALVDVDLTLTGINSKEIENLLAELQGGGKEEYLFDAASETAKIVEPKTKRGDVWLLGKHRLVCGDATDVTVINRMLNGIVPECCIYDPPYDMEYAWSFLYPAPAMLIFHDYKSIAAACAAAAHKPYVYQFIWDCCTSWWTPNRPLARHKGCLVATEQPEWFIDRATFIDGKKRMKKNIKNTRGSYEYTPLPGGRVRLSTVFSSPTAQENTGHAHSKPVKWVAALISGTGAKSVIDLFGGSGTSIIACEMLKIQCWMVELSEKMCDVIVKRWETYTRETAVLVPSEKP